MAVDLPDDDRHNHSIDRLRDLLPLVPATARTALDVGCGEGFASRALAAKGLAVTGIDPDAASLVAARTQDTTGITYLEADLLTADLPGSYDVVVAVAVLHHMDMTAGLTRMRELLSPGGLLLIVGCAASTMPRDAVREAAAVAVNLVGRLGHRAWDHPSPTVWPPPVTYDQVRDESARLLPGSEFRRHLLWRYTLTWKKPA